MNKKIIFILSVIVVVVLIGIVVFLINKNSITNNDNEKINIVSNNENKIENFNIENEITSDITKNEEYNNNKEDNIERIEEMKLYIKVNNRTLTATLNDNSSTRELVNKLKDGSIVIDMEDYSKMEKVGSLGFSLPRNDEHINTEAGDLILYQGNSFVIYYDNNSWSLTRLGKIDNISQKELKEILGTGSIKVTLSIEE